MINKINATVLFVRDFDACVKFYRDTLGLKVKETDVGFMSFDVAGQELALMDLPTASQMISEEAIQPAKEGVHRVLLAAFVKDTDEAYEELKARGVQFIKLPTTQPWGQRTAYFKDPDGNIWEISHFLPKE
jgi:lactoylglutathione lyase